MIPNCDGADGPCHMTWERVFVDLLGIKNNLMRIAQSAGGTSLSGDRNHRGAFFIMPFPGIHGKLNTGHIMPLPVRTLTPIVPCLTS